MLAPAITISITPTRNSIGYRWAVYRNGRQIVSGWRQTEEQAREYAELAIRCFVSTQMQRQR